MGAIYEAIDQRLNRTVAIKESFAETDETLRAFEREAQLLANLRHPALPTVSDYFIDGARRFLVMEFIHDDDLSEKLKQRAGPFPSGQVWQWADELLDALAYLHGHQPPVIHRDIKPANLKLATDGRVVLLDFGLAKGAAGQMPAGTLSRSLLGYSPNYASLEQMQGEKSTPKSDLYSLAATLYHLLTNVKPPDALKRVNALVNDEADPLAPIHKITANVPMALAQIVTQGLALKPAERPASAAEMRARLRNPQPVAPPPAGDEPTRVPSTRGETTATPAAKSNRQIVVPITPPQKEAPARPAQPRSALSNLAGRFNAWLAQRPDSPQHSAQAGRNQSLAERAAEFICETEPNQPEGTHAANATGFARDEAGESREDKAAAEVEEMVATASVVRTEPVNENVNAARAAQAARAARRAEQLAASMGNYRMPPVEFLHEPTRHEQADEELRGLAVRLAETLKGFNITGRVEYICPGPVFTTFEFKPDVAIKLARVRSLVDDLCLALKVEFIELERVSDKPYIGFIVPNRQREDIPLRDVIAARHFQEAPSKITLALGKTVDGMNYVADLALLPHLLIAGATGTGKSVCLHSLIVSMLYKARPDEVKFIMIDPKGLELGLYADIPHLATPVISDPMRAASALNWTVRELGRRNKQLTAWGVRDLDGFNQEVARRNLAADYDAAGQPWVTLPYLVIIVDELAELARNSEYDVEGSITQLAQMGRAVGIHLILTTQRPSVDVITGTIKANFPARIAFRVSAKIDSRTVIDDVGAERLLGRGDMLLLLPGKSQPVRLHGAYVDQAEISRVVAHVKAQSSPVYDEGCTGRDDGIHMWRIWRRSSTATSCADL